MTKVRLLKAHTDAGKDYQPGHVIELAADQAKWLVQIEVAEPAPAPEAAGVKAKKQPTP
jgi:hypothetical protein